MYIHIQMFGISKKYDVIKHAALAFPNLNRRRRNSGAGKRADGRFANERLKDATQDQTEKRYCKTDIRSQS